MSEQLTLGVIGHVDHGKTALVRALTGIETDRLREERERGLSIVLGFSYLQTGDAVIDLIDAPGHEDFIRAMISGAMGMDGVVLIIAANEGVMPQTREHFDIARLLGVDRGLIVITKIDQVSSDELDDVTAEIRDFVKGTFLEHARIAPTSAVTHEGIDALKKQLDELAQDPVERPRGRDFYLPLDRVFTMRGFGLVGTGTLRGGSLRSNDRVQIMPGGQAATVRALQNHSEIVAEVLPGQRVAVNLRHIKRDEVRRGDTLASPGFLVPTRRIDAELDLLDDNSDALKNGASVRLLIGTTEAIAKLRLLDQKQLEPGGTALVQLRCDRDIATHRSERFLIRSYSPMRTIGGGRVLDAKPTRHRRFDASVTDRLKTTAAGDPIAILKGKLAAAGVLGIDVDALREELGLAEEALTTIVAAATPVYIDSNIIVSAAVYDSLKEQILAELQSYHAANPHQQGLSTGSLRSQMDSRPAEKVFRHAIDDLAEHGELHSDKGTVRLTGFDPLAGLTDHERKLVKEITESFLKYGLAPPPLNSVVGSDNRKRKLYQLLIDNGELVRLRTYDRKANMVLHAETLENVKQRLQDRYPHPDKFALSDVRDLLGSTRKYVVPLMEHLDATGVTIRLGDMRHLREH